MLHQSRGSINHLILICSCPSTNGSLGLFRIGIRHLLTRNLEPNKLLVKTKLFQTYPFKTLEEKAARGKDAGGSQKSPRRWGRRTRDWSNHSTQNANQIKFHSKKILGVLLHIIFISLCVKCLWMMIGSVKPPTRKEGILLGERPFPLTLTHEYFISFSCGVHCPRKLTAGIRHVIGSI